eukprot:COSAG01_NODE_5812_length_4018_cov_5.428936_4_plen_118_part_00
MHSGISTPLTWNCRRDWLARFCPWVVQWRAATGAATTLALAGAVLGATQHTDSAKQRTVVRAGISMIRAQLVTVSEPFLRLQWGGGVMGPKHVGESQSVLMMMNPIILLPYPYGSIN